MKQTGLRNRFSQETRNLWIYHYSCLVCGMNQWDALHHVISPSFYLYIDGKHNESVFNSCPIHNYKHPDVGGETDNCHIDNEAWLFKLGNVKHLLRTIFELQVKSYQFEPKENDIDFLVVYFDIYDKDFLKRYPTIYKQVLARKKV